MSESTNQPLPDDIKQALMHGDLSGLNAEQQLLLYHQTCASLGLNPLTNPLSYLELKGEGDKKRLVLYATKGCADQLRRIHGITVQVVGRVIEDGLCIVTARSSDASGRYDEDYGIVPIGKEVGTWKTAPSGKRYFEGDGIFQPFEGEARANAIKKSTTQAKRRSTLSFCGLGMLDESEIEGIAGAVIRETSDVVTQTSGVRSQRSALPESSAVEVPITIPSPEKEKIVTGIQSMHEPTREQVRTGTPASTGPKLPAKEVDDLLSFLAKTYESDERAWVKVRAVMRIPDGQECTRARVRLHLTRAQYDQLQAEAKALLGDESSGDKPEDDGQDFSGPDPSQQPQDNTQVSGEGGSDAQSAEVSYEASSGVGEQDEGHVGESVVVETFTSQTGPGKYASDAQKDELKDLAKHISPDEEERTKRSIDKHKRGLPLEVFEMMKTGLKNRLVRDAATEA